MSHQNARFARLENNMKELQCKVDNFKCSPAISGIPGSKIYSGSTLPNPQFGGIGDMYIDTTTGNFYIKTLCGGWHTSTPNGHVLLQYWVESQTQDPQSIFSPNPAAFTSPDVDATITPLGLGSIRGSPTGNTRGSNAVDLQISRDNNNQVSSGNNSVIGGGQSNTASGDISVVGGGVLNVASGDVSFIPGGVLNSAVFDFSNANGLFSYSAGAFSSANGLFVGAIDDFSFATGLFNEPGSISGNPRQFMVGGGNDPSSRSNLFSVDAAGNIHVPGSVISGPADHAEYFESNDSAKYPVGMSVAFTGAGRKIKVAGDTDVPFGVVSQKPSSIGNAAEGHWSQKYIQTQVSEDVYDVVYQTETIPYQMDTFKDGQYIRTVQNFPKKVAVMEEVNVIQDGKPVGKKTAPKRVKTGTRIATKSTLNPNFDSNKTYVPRSQRPEWNVIAMIGVVDILKTTPKNPSWTLIASPSTNDDQYDTYYIH